jgi:adenosylmethionine-8-amino-7-oxononanoate aminotransferase
MTTTTHPSSTDDLTALARRHLWGQFTHLTAWTSQTPTIVRGEGSWVYDTTGKRYFDGFSAQFVAQLGHGRTDLAEAAASQAAQLGFYPLWSFGHEPGIRLAATLAELAPGELNRVFSRPAGQRPSSRPGNWPCSITAPPVSPSAEKSCPATSLITERRWARCP